MAASKTASLSANKSTTLRQQEAVEGSVQLLLHAYASISSDQHSGLLELWKDQHVAYLERGLDHLASGCQLLDSSRPWLCYWILHSLALIGEPLDLQSCDRAIDFLQHCQDPDGGYGGGPGQMPHLATTYAAVSALVTIGGETALASIQRETVLHFLLRMKVACGGFRMHDEGEIDVRGCYTALAVAHMLDIMIPELLENVGEYVASCQTYEGGIGGEPGAEAHGGYTYCGLAALILADKVELLDLPSLLHWVVFRQAKVEGGFQGRTNKLVDGCYSFWQGGSFYLLQQLMGQLMAQQTGCYKGPIESVAPGEENLDAEAQQESSLSRGTERDVDEERLRRAFIAGSQSTDDVTIKEVHLVTAEQIFHVSDTIIERSTSYVRCEAVEFNEECQSEQTLSVATVGESSSSLGLQEDLLYGPLYNTQAIQGYLLLCCQVLEGGLRDKPGKSRDYYHTCYCLSGLSAAQYGNSRSLSALPPPRAVLGPYSNLLDAIHPVCNVKLDRYYEARDYFRKR